MSSLYRRQVVVLDLSKTGSCLGCIKDGVRSCQVLLLLLLLIINSPNIWFFRLIYM